MEPQEIDDIIIALNQCGIGRFSYKCDECPLFDDYDCEGTLFNKVIEALKRLKFLETPTKQEQPELDIDCEGSGA